MKNVLIIVLVLLLASVGLNVWQWRGARDQEINLQAQNQQAQRDIDRNRAVAQSAKARGDSLQLAHTKDSLEFESRKSALLVKIKTYQKTIASMRQDVTPQIDSLPMVKEFVALQDSTIVKQDSVIVELSGQLTDQGKSFTAQLMAKDVQINALDTIGQDFQKQLVISQTQTKQEKKKVKFFKIVSGVLAAGIFYIAISK